MDPTETAELLDRSADLIEFSGWVQGRGTDWVDGVQSYCLVSAMAHAASGKPVKVAAQMGAINRARDAVCVWLRQNRPECARWPGDSLSHLKLIMWNDLSTRTQEDVTEALRGSAKALREGELTVG